ncbi:hypothetical protein B0H19DRAFT_1083355 [Mycena capillaripes]|nr:hypothetical protein B0H19DRAFT_1083355 [Mycena capillaripes]
MSLLFGPPKVEFHSSAWLPIQNNRIFLCTSEMSYERGKMGVLKVQNSHRVASGGRRKASNKRGDARGNPEDLPADDHLQRRDTSGKLILNLGSGLVYKNSIQLVKHDHCRTVSTFIREQMDVLVQFKDSKDISDHVDALVLSNINIGSKLKTVSFSTICFLPAIGYKLPNGKWIRFTSTDSVDCAFSVSQGSLRLFEYLGPNDRRSGSHPMYSISKN